MLAPFPLINIHFLTFLLSINIGVVAISLVFIIYLICEQHQTTLSWEEKYLERMNGVMTVIKQLF